MTRLTIMHGRRAGHRPSTRLSILGRPRFAGAFQQFSQFFPGHSTSEYRSPGNCSVNLGGWLNTEPFISPALYEKYLGAQTPAIDEWTLSTNMAADSAGGGREQLEQHYSTLILPQSFFSIPN